MAAAEDLILNQENTSILDNFLDEMLDLMNQKNEKIRCFVLLFIEKAWFYFFFYFFLYELCLINIFFLI